jgi:pyruvate/2-oxoglutarate dehydrogenase complex dihydrolipoamide dehydrogenase (E3) component
MQAARSSAAARLTAPDVTPHDEHNATLVANVHPPGRANPEPASRYNLVVIGAGTAGLVTAAGAAGLGAKVALVERHLMGGDCLNVGCVPSKCVIRSSRAVAELREAAALGVRVPAGAEADFGAVMERMRRLRARISDHDSVRRFEQELGVDVFLGEARFAGSDTVEVGGATLRFKRAVIATGARAAHPPIEGLADAGFLTNETVFSLTERLRRLAVVGGGPIGCELAQAFRRLGCEVVLFHRAGHLLNREDADAAAIVQRAFLRDGVRLVLDARIARVGVRRGEKVIELAAGAERGEIAVDEILVGAGRAPNVEGLNLEGVGVAYDGRRGVVVDDHLRTTNPRIYAAGDVCMSQKFTHAADFAARVVIQNSLFLGRRRLSALTIPWCTYTDPEIAHVGLSEREAERRGVAITTFTRHLRDVDRAIADGEEEGLVKIHVRKGTDRIVGATIVARHAGEMIGEVTLAMTAKVGLGALANVIHPYPTQAEAIRQAGDAYNRTRLTPRVRHAFARWLAWTR